METAANRAYKTEMSSLNPINPKTKIKSETEGAEPLSTSRHEFIESLSDREWNHSRHWSFDDRDEFTSDLLGDFVIQDDVGKSLPLRRCLAVGSYS